MLWYGVQDLHVDSTLAQTCCALLQAGSAAVWQAVW